MENVRKCSTLISTAFMATQVNAGARRVIGKSILILTLFLILGNITAARLHAQTAPEETDFGLCATYTNPEILEGPLSFGLSALPSEVNSCFQFTAPEPLSGVIVAPTISSASLSFGNTDLTVANLYTGDDDVYPIYMFRLDTAGDIDLLQYGFLFTNGVVAEGIVLNSSFEMNIKGTDIATGIYFHYRYTTSSQTLAEVNLSPIPDAGGNITIDSSERTSTTLNGTATDTDSDSLTYKWLEGTTELQASTAVVGGAAPLSSLSQLSLGAHTLTLEVDDGQSIATNDMILTINNSPPDVAPGGGGTFQLGDYITLSGSVSDFDGDGLDYIWFEELTDFSTSFIGTTAGGDPAVLPDVSIIGGLSLGNHTITLEADDGTNAPVTASITVDMIDTTEPTISATASPGILWPPNHKMVDVVIQANANDNSGSVTLTAFVESSELPDSDGDGNTIPDYTTPVIDQLTGEITLQLRSERKGKGTGRTYTITATATDGEGNSSDAIVEVKAPHDKGKE